MSSSFKDRQQRKTDTKQAAAAFLDDIAHLRAIVNSDAPDPTLIRLSSNILRRLLYNRELDLVAAPRIGKFHLVAPDNDQHEQAIARRDADVVLFQSGSPLLFPMLQGFRVEFSKTNAEQGTMGVTTPWKERNPFDPNTKLVRLDGFLSQRVICFRNRWANRREVIGYAAVCASGVHSKPPTKSVELMLARARFALRFTKQGGEPAAQLDFDVIGNPHHPPPEPVEFTYDQDRIDLVMVELLASSYYLCASPDVANLEAVIRAELGAS